MKIHEYRFYCEAIDDVIWKVVISDTRSSNCKITVTITRVGKKTIEQVYYGTSRFLLSAVDYEYGVGGYGLTEDGRRQAYHHLVRCFLV